MRKAFEHFDADHDGFISSSELRKAMKKTKINLTKSQIEVMIKEADNDGDGQVSYDEFVGMMMNQ